MLLYAILLGLCLSQAVREPFSGEKNTTTPDTTTPLTTTPLTTTPFTTTPLTTTPFTTTPCTTTPYTTTPGPNTVPKFFVRNESNVCILFEANITLFVPYFSSKNEVKSFQVTQSASASGSCDENNEFLKLSWTPEKSPTLFNLTLTFKKMAASPSAADEVIVNSIKFDYNLSSDVFPATNHTGILSVSAEGTFFKVPSAQGYSCEAQQNISLTGTNAPTVQFSAAAVHVEAFRNSTSTDFGNSTYDCTSDSTPNNVVPIVVGVCFAVLIVLAIVVFVIGNRRRQQGYQAI